MDAQGNYEQSDLIQLKAQVLSLTQRVRDGDTDITHSMQELERQIAFVEARLAEQAAPPATRGPRVFYLRPRGREAGW